MDLFLYNTSWMAFNLYLALLPVLFMWLFFKSGRKLYKWLFFFLWAAYLPNAIYVMTDMSHLIDQWSEIHSILGKAVFVLQYALFEIVGLGAFIYALYPFEKLVKYPTLVFVGINLLMGPAMVLGRIERANSWDIFLAPDKVVQATLNVISSPELIGLSLLLGLFSTFFYFLFRKPVMRILNSSLH